MIEQLEAIGLTNGEARVYKALCELGTSSVGPICDVSKVHRSIIYQVLEKLVEKGIVSFIVEGTTKMYQAAQPTMLLQYVEQEEQTLADHKKALVDVFPLITQLQASGKRSSATVYHGANGLFTATYNILERLKKGEYYYMVNIPAVQPSFTQAQWEKFQRTRVQKGIRGRQLYVPQVDDAILKSRNKHAGVEARRMPIDFETPPMYYFTYSDVTVIALIKGGNFIAIEIINKDIADGFRAYCEWLWKHSTKAT